MEEKVIWTVFGMTLIEFVIDKPICKRTDDTHDVLVPEAHVHVASEPTEPQQGFCEVLRKKRKCQLFCDIKQSSRKTCHPLRDCTLQAHVQHYFGENFTLVDVFMKAVNAQELLVLLYLKLIFMLHRKGAIFWTNHDELKAFLGNNYLMGINKLPSVRNYREVDHYTGNDLIKNLMRKQRFQDIL